MANYTKMYSDAFSDVLRVHGFVSSKHVKHEFFRIHGDRILNYVYITPTRHKTCNILVGIGHLCSGGEFNARRMIRSSPAVKVFSPAINSFELWEIVQAVSLEEEASQIMDFCTDLEGVKSMMEDNVALFNKYALPLLNYAINADSCLETVIKIEHALFERYRPARQKNKENNSKYYGIKQPMESFEMGMIPILYIKVKKYDEALKCYDSRIQYQEESIIFDLATKPDIAVPKHLPNNMTRDEYIISCEELWQSNHDSLKQHLVKLKTEPLYLALKNGNRNKVEELLAWNEEIALDYFKSIGVV